MSKKQTQCARVLELLSSKSEVSALELSSISLQYAARVCELRKTGATIANRVEVKADGTRHGYYRLVCHSPIPRRIVDPAEPQHKPPKGAPGSLFPENEPCKAENFQYPD